MNLAREQGFFEFSVASKSKPYDPPYIVPIYPQGVLSCPCMRWRMLRKDIGFRKCRHVEELGQAPALGRGRIKDFLLLAPFVPGSQADQVFKAYCAGKRGQDLLGSDDVMVPVLPDAPATPTRRRRPAAPLGRADRAVAIAIDVAPVALLTRPRRSVFID